MRTVSLGTVSALTLALALAGVASAQSPAPSAGPGGTDITAVPHPAHIHTGSCAELGDVIAPLDDVTLIAGSDRVGTSTTTVDLSLRAILDSPHAIMSHASAEDLGTYIACADLTSGRQRNLLVVALEEQNDSGFAGVAYLRSNDRRTVVNLSLTAPEPSGDPATPTSSLEPVSSVAPASVSPGSSAPAASGEQVNIVDFEFAPAELTISAGTTVTWTNSDSTQHTATAEDASFDSGVLAQNDTFSQTFDTAGTFSYICTIHPNMTGTVTVQ